MYASIDVLSDLHGPVYKVFSAEHSTTGYRQVLQEEEGPLPQT